MASKVTITADGVTEVFEFDGSHKPMSEALALEEGLKCTYAKWETDMAAGSARAMCGFIWLIWQRDGRDVKLEDMLADIKSGKLDIDLASLDIEPGEGDADPTIPPPGASPSTGDATSPRSASSASGRSRSASSSKATSKP